MRTKAEIRVERYLKGDGPDTIEVLDDICVGAIAREPIGRPHLLFLNFDDQFGSLPTANGCLGSGPVEGSWSSINLSQVEMITGSGDSPDDSLDEPQPPDTGGFPLVPAVALAIVGPVVFLLGAAFIWPRRRA